MPDKVEFSSDSVRDFADRLAAEQNSSEFNDEFSNPDIDGFAKRISGENVSRETNNEQGFFSNFAEGFNEQSFEDASLNVTAGKILTEKIVGVFPGGQELVEFGRETEKLQFWKPQVWEAEDKLNAISDKNSREYQAAWESLENIKQNMKDDLEGKFQSEGSDPVNFDQMVDAIKSNPGSFLGSMSKSILADPALLLIPGGMAKAGNAAIKATKNASKFTQVAAKLAAQAGGAVSVGVPLGATADVIDQLDQNPDKPIDFDRVADTALFTGGIAAALPFAAGAGKAIQTGVNKGIVTPIAESRPIQKVGEMMDTRKINAIQKKAQRIYNKAINEEGVPGLTKEGAIQRALPQKKADVINKQLEDIDVFMSDVALTQRAAADAKPGILRATADNLSDFRTTAANGWNDLTQPITSRLRQMGFTNIAKGLDEHDMNVGTDIQRKQALAQTFSDSYGQLTESQKAVAALNINNGSFKAVRDQFPDDFQKAFDDVRVMLDGEHEDMIDVGMKVGKTENYFPREIANYDDYLRAQGVEPAVINKQLAKAINSKLNLQGSSKLSESDMTHEMRRKHLSEKEIASVIAREAQKTDPSRSVSVSTSALASRSIDTVSPELLSQYLDPRAALNNHINRVTSKIHDRRFFGGKKIDEDLEAFGSLPNDETIMASYIKDYVARVTTGKEILPSEMDQVVKLLNARFIGGKQRAKPFWNNTKNLLYAATLGNPIAASTQLGDLGAAAYINGYKQGINGIIGEAIEGTRFKMKDFGLEAIPEIESMNKTQQILDWTLRKGGFKAMDRLGKETILNSTYKKLRAEMFDPKTTDAKKFEFFKKRYGKQLGEDEVRKIMDGVASGDPTNPDVRLAMYSDLTRVQPISMSQMPVAYLNNPNMRIFFMLKTFTLKQIDLMRNEVINEISTGARNGSASQVRDGAMNMAKIVGTIGAANMGVDYTKRWLTGKEADLPDVMVDTILRNYGLSTYTTDMILRGQIFGAGSKIIAPPFSVIENPARQLMGVDTNGRWIDSIPVVGRTANFGRQVIDEHF